MPNQNQHYGIGYTNQYELVCADGLGDYAVDKCISDSPEKQAEEPAPSTKTPDTEQLSMDAAMSPAQSSGNGRETRDSDVAQAMVDEVLEETVATMLSADARGFAQ